MEVALGVCVCERIEFQQELGFIETKAIRKQGKSSEGEPHHVCRCNYAFKLWQDICASNETSCNASDTENVCAVETCVRHILNVIISDLMDISCLYVCQPMFAHAHICAQI